MGRAIAYLYGIACYVLFLGTFLYAIGFVGNFAVPKSIDSGAPGPFGPVAARQRRPARRSSPIQHSVMARPGVQGRVDARRSQVRRAQHLRAAREPRADPAVLAVAADDGRRVAGRERARPRMALWGLFAIGWLIVLSSTFLINHFDLFGLRQVHLNSRGVPYTDAAVPTPCPLPAGAPPALPGLPDRLLGDAPDDGRPPRVLDRDDGLHPASRSSSRNATW